MCESCRGVYQQFKKDFPNAIINVVSGCKSKKGNSPWKTPKNLKRVKSYTDPYVEKYEMIYSEYKQQIEE